MTDSMKKFQEFLDAALSPGILEHKTKQLVALAAALAAGCEPWTDFGLAVAREANASQEEIEEVAAIAMAVNAFKTRSLFRNKFPDKEREPAPAQAQVIGLKKAPDAAPGRTWGIWAHASVWSIKNENLKV